jgi:CubicO group peptidase (beta-lactamase class C family)
MRITIVWLAGLVFGVGLADMAKADPKIDETILQARALVSSVASEYPGLAVTVTVDGEEVWAEGYGFADLESETPAMPDTRFNVYSVAKMLTGIGAARLAEMGQLDLDASLVDIVDGLQSSYAAVTPRHLIGHLSGVPHYLSDEDWRVFSDLHCSEPADALPHFLDRPLVTEPGVKRTYTTYGYVLLSEVLSRQSPQRSYTKFMHDEVFMVAGMENTQLDSKEFGSQLKATPYTMENGTWEKIEGLDASCKFGGGGFLSSARDLALFGMAFYDHKLLSPAVTKQVAQPFLLADGESTYYGFGMDTNTFEYGGREVHWARHSGGSPGGRSFLVVLLTHRVSVGIAANADGPSLRSVASNLAYLFAGVDP